MGRWRRVKATRYWLRETLGLPRIDRTQALTSESFEEYFARDVGRLKTKGKRLGRMRSQFARFSNVELEVEFLRTHLSGLEAMLGGRDASGEALEVGAGFGRTLIPLSLLMPDVEFSGVELTKSGPDAARRYWTEARREINEIAGAVGEVHHKSIPWKQFETGDGKALPFADGSFDVAYTNLVLEQIPYRVDAERVMREMFRVSRRGACFLEPWADAQSTLNNAYVKQNGYFQEFTRILRDVGFSRVDFKKLDFQHNLLFRLGYAIAYK